MLIIKSDALWNREKRDHLGNRKMAKRIAHARQDKTKKPRGRDNSMRYKWSRRLALTKQINPRPAKNDPSTHDSGKVETNVEKGQSLPDAPRLRRPFVLRSSSGKTEPVSRGVERRCFVF